MSTQCNTNIAKICFLIWYKFVIPPPQVNYNSCYSMIWYSCYALGKCSGSISFNLYSFSIKRNIFSPKKLPCCLGSLISWNMAYNIISCLPPLEHNTHNTLHTHNTPHTHSTHRIHTQLTHRIYTHAHAQYSFGPDGTHQDTLLTYKVL